MVQSTLIYLCVYASLLVDVTAYSSVRGEEELNDEHAKDVAGGMLSVDELHDRSNASAEELALFEQLSYCGGKACNARECCVSYACQLHTAACNRLGLGLPKTKKEPNVGDQVVGALDWGFKQLPGMDKGLKGMFEPEEKETPKFRAFQTPRGGGITFYYNIGGKTSQRKTTSTPSGACVPVEDIPDWIPFDDDRHTRSMCGR